MEYTAFAWHTGSLHLLLHLLFFLQRNVKPHRDLLLFLYFAMGQVVVCIMMFPKLKKKKIERKRKQRQRKICLQMRYLWILMYKSNSVKMTTQYKHSNFCICILSPLPIKEIFKNKVAEEVCTMLAHLTCSIVSYPA